jgi:hypothetical protein
VLAAQQLHELVLRAVRVLVLVHEQPAEARPVLGQPLRVLLEDAHREHEQIVEGDGVRQPQRVLELVVDGGDDAAERVEREALVLRLAHERVLGVGDGGEHALGRPLLRRDPLPLHHALHHGEGVVLVVDGEARLTPDEVRRGAQHARADRVEGTDPHAAERLAEQALDAVAHLAGGLVGEGDGEDLGGRDAVVADEARDARGEDARLAGARAGEDEDRALVVQHGLALRGIEAVERLVERRCAGKMERHAGSITSKVAPRSDGTSSSRP